jgi:hypothetical protein
VLPPEIGKRDRTPEGRRERHRGDAADGAIDAGNVEGLS